jgi:hypothetical protein
MFNCLPTICFSTLTCTGTSIHYQDNSSVELRYGLGNVGLGNVGLGSMGLDLKSLNNTQHKSLMHNLMIRRFGSVFLSVLLAPVHTFVHLPLIPENIALFKGYQLTQFQQSSYSTSFNQALDGGKVLFFQKPSMRYIVTICCVLAGQFSTSAAMRCQEGSRTRI